MLLVDGTGLAQALTLSNGSATYTFSSNTSGSHVIVANYSGDATFAASTGSLVLTVGSGSSGNPGFTLSATSVTVSAGNSGTATITITPVNGYTGAIAWTATVSPALSNYCYTLNNTTVSGAGKTAATLTIYTNSTSCSSGSVSGSTAGRNISGNRWPGVCAGLLSTLSHAGIARTGWTILGMLMTGVLMLLLRRQSVLRGGLSVLLAIALVGCGSSGSTPSSSSNEVAAKGSYTVTITGTDTTTSSITATTTITLTID